MAAKEAVVLVVDVGAGMDGAPMEHSKRIMSNILGEKFVQGGQHQFAVVLFGSSTTNNELSECDEGGYEGVELLRDFDKPTVGLLEAINDLEATEVDSDAIDGLVYGVHVLDEFVGKKKFQKRVFLLTAAASAIANSEQIPGIGETIKKHDVTLNVVALGDMTSSEDARGQLLTDVQVQNEEMLRQLAEVCDGGYCCTSEQVSRRFGRWRMKTTVSRPKYKGFMDISTKIRFLVEICGKTVLANVPSLKKRTKEGETVKLHRIYENKESGDLFEKDENIRGYLYGKQLVPMTDIHDVILGWSAPQCFSVLGFIDRDKVSRHLFMGTVDVVAAACNSPSENVAAFSAFVEALAERDQVGIVRYIKKEGSPPFLGCLSPSVEAYANVLYLNQLPFADDVREYDFAPLMSTSAYRPTEGGISAAQKFIEALDLGRDTLDELSSTEMLKPENTYNPVLQRLFDVLDRRVLDDTSPVGDVPDDILDYMNPNTALFESAASAIKDFASQFQLEMVEKESRSRRMHWRDLVQSMGVYQQSTPAPADSSQPLSNLMMGRVKEVGRQHPVEDYHQMVLDPEQLSPATSQIFKIALELVTLSYQGDRYDLAVDCVTEARKACLEGEDFKTFNDGMETLATALKVAHPDFWRKLADNSLGLIDCSEVANSDITPQTALEFLRTETVDTTAQIVDNDDDFADLDD